MAREKGLGTKEPDRSREEEAEAAKIWAVYVSEAEKYDRGLVESWKSDMEGLLIFAALFSSILTAFLIESYKSLNPDSGDTTVQLLSQISQQLAASANGSAYNVPPPTPFKPSVPSLICNALWFISLGFSLACALIATFVQQWARDFLHKADMHSAPLIRARIFSYLYYGLKRFQMHTVVEIIPILLHGSLLIFFCGLVAFLIPVNIAMTVIASTVLGIVGVGYSIMTLLPVRYLDCPYRTPLSGAFWKVFRGFQTFWRRRHPRPDAADESGTFDDVDDSSDNETMVATMVRTAMAPSKERSERDSKALVWTVKSLADDAELEPFVEAIPDLLWGPDCRRDTYEPHIRSLVQNPHVKLLNRIATLLQSCYSGILASDVSQRRLVTCCKAFWAIASLSSSNESTTEVLDFAPISMPRSEFTNSEIGPYIISARAIMLWRKCCAMESQLISLRDDLATFETELGRKNGSPKLEQIKNALSQIQDKYVTHHLIWTYYSLDSDRDVIFLRSVIDNYLTEIPYRIKLQFISQSASLESPPYYWRETLSALQISDAVPGSLKTYVETTIDTVISSQLNTQAAVRGLTKDGWIDQNISELVSFWQPNDADRIPPSIIIWLHCRNWEAMYIEQELENHLWRCYSNTLLPELREESLTVLWRLASLPNDHYVNPESSSTSDSHFTSVELILKALPITESPFTGITCSIIALLKQRMLLTRNFHNFPGFGTINDIFIWFTHYLLPTKTGIQFPEEFQSMYGYDTILPRQWSAINNLKVHRVSEACLAVVVEYLQHCTSDILPYKAVETLHELDMARYLIPEAPIHHTHQIRLANSIHSIVSAGLSMDLLDRILNCSFWSLYVEGVKTEEEVKTHRERLQLNCDTDTYYHGDSSSRFWPWLDCPDARQKIKDAFAVYHQKVMSSTGSSRDILPRLQKILEGIDCWHLEPDVVNATGAEIEQSISEPDDNRVVRKGVER